MKIFISADIEGVAGVVVPQQGQPGNTEYERARRLMTQEVNAAVEGALAAGATEILVNDSHGPMVNLLPEELNPAADLLLGCPKPFSMAAGLSKDFNAVFLIGYHASATGYGVLAHTTNGFAFRTIRLNGIPHGEAAIYGAYAGELGVPVVLLSGDDRMADENRTFFPQAVFATVKTAFGARSARQIGVHKARSIIRLSAENALKELADKPLYRPTVPLVAEFEMNAPVLADQAEILPPAKRINAATIAFDCATVAEAIGWMSAVSAMSCSFR